jgi:phosphoenolpyruvate carboxylase
MREYALLVGNEETRERILGLIEREYHRTREHLEALYGGPIEEKFLNVSRFMTTRQEGLRMLHLLQIDLLKTWRRLKADGRTEEADQLLPQLLLTVNAISGGLRSTG